MARTLRSSASRRKGLDTPRRSSRPCWPARAFKAISGCPPVLRARIGPASVQADALKAKLRAQKIADAGAKAAPAITGSIQQVGYQDRRFSVVQIARQLGSAARFIQQGTQLISMSGPRRGAVLGAVGAVGVLAQKFLATEDARQSRPPSRWRPGFKQAEAARTRPTSWRTRMGMVAAALQAELWLLRVAGSAGYDTEVAKLKAMPKYIGGGRRSRCPSIRNVSPGKTCCPTSGAAGYHGRLCRRLRRSLLRSESRRRFPSRRRSTRQLLRTRTWPRP